MKNDESLYVAQKRAEAKKWKKNGYDKQHCVILDEIAKREGYKNWAELMRKNNENIN